MNQRVVKFVIENNLVKQISSRTHNLKDVKKLIKVEKAFQRKSYCLNGVNLDFATNINPV